MASRRDQLLATVGNLHDQLNGARRIPEALSSRGGGSSSDHGVAAAPRSPGQRGESHIANQIGRGIGALQRGISGLDLHNDNVFTAPHAISRSPEQSPAEWPSGPLSRQSNVSHTTEAGPPSYARREGGQDLVQSEFHYASKSGKLAARVIGSGSLQHPVYMPDLFDTFSGDVYVRLDKPEAISAVRVRLKCCLTTCVLANIPGQPGPPRPMTQELILLDETQTLWQATSSDTRVEGVRQFRFEMSFPQGIWLNGKRYALPPSFQIGEINKLMEGASIKYYAKVVLARQGLLNPNERIIFPLVYMPLTDRQTELVTRSQIYQRTGTLPSPKEDPSAWIGQQSKQDVAGSSSGGSVGLFGKRSNNKNKWAWAEYVALVPKPAVFDRHTPLMCYIKVTSSDLRITGNIKSGCISVKLIQSVQLSAQGCASTSDNVVATFAVSSESRDEPRSESTSQGPVHYNIFRGSFDLPVLPVTFSAPNISTSYALIFEFKLPLASKYSLKVPIKIISTLAPTLTAAPPAPQPSSAIPIPGSRPPTKAEQSLSESSASPVPQQQQTPTYALPPPLPPRTPSSQREQHAQAQQQQQQQTFEQEVPDLPPSYWEVVEQGQQMDRPVRRSRFAVI